MHRNDLAPAGLLRRTAAMCYDLFLCTGLVMVLTLLLVLARGGEAIPPGSWWYGVALLAVNFLFFGFSWTHGGQTLGAQSVETASNRHGWEQADLETSGASISGRVALAASARTGTALGPVGPGRALLARSALRFTRSLSPVAGLAHP